MKLKVPEKHFPEKISVFYCELALFSTVFRRKNWKKTGEKILKKMEKFSGGIDCARTGIFISLEIPSMKKNKKKKKYDKTKALLLPK